MSILTLQADGDAGTQFGAGVGDWSVSTGRFGNNGTFKDTAAIRFSAGPAIPQGAKIKSAILGCELIGYLTGAVEVDGTWYGDDVDNSPAFGTGAARPSARIGDQTTAQIAYTFVEATFPAPGPFTIDVTAIVQEIVDRPGWASGQAISILFLSTEPGSGHAVDFEDQLLDPSPPTLTITLATTPGKSYHNWEMTQ